MWDSNPRPDYSDDGLVNHSSVTAVATSPSVLIISSDHPEESVVGAADYF